MQVRDKIVFYLNGKRQEAGAEDAAMMLADYLRVRRSLPGTKIVCAEGDCGACTVLRLVPGRTGDQYQAVNSCILTVAQMDGSSLVTVDALADGDKLSPVQEAMVRCHGSQCGFCTPGFVMALTGLVEKRQGKEGFTAVEAKNALTGNLCRCTGYQPIVDATMAIRPSECIPLKKRYYSASQGKELKAAAAKPVRIAGSEFSFFAPKTFKDASAYLKKNPDARILSAGTDLGVLHNKRRRRLTRALSLHLVPGLDKIQLKGASRVSVGAGASLTELRRFLKKRVPEFARFLDVFASPQIKNVATLAGNVANASPIGDTPPFLLVAGAEVHAAGGRGKRVIPIDRFFEGYRKTALKPGEAIAAIEFEIPRKTETLSLYKVSQRKDLDISSVSAAFRVEWQGTGAKRRIARARIAMGGVAATPVRLRRTEEALAGAAPDRATLERAIGVLQSEIEPISDLRGSSAFRRVVTENLLRRFFEEQVIR
jgi:xanthine dehydrogenase small subunit